MNRVHPLDIVLLTVLLGLQAPTDVHSQEINSSLPVTHPVTVLEGGNQICPPEEQLQTARAEFEQDLSNIIRDIIPGLPAACPGQSQESPAASCLEILQCNGPRVPSKYYWVTASDGTAAQIYCDMTRECSCAGASVGGWSRVAFLNMSDPTNQCPPAWREITDPVRTCGRTSEDLTGGAGCSSTSFSTYNISYSRICGRVTGYQFGFTNSFNNYNEGFNTIEDPYVDGVVILLETERQHVWSFGASRSENEETDSFYSVTACPCVNPLSSQIIPPFVGDDYFCETALTTIDGVSPGFFPDDPLWDGENCGSESTCCELNDPPYFCKSLPEPTLNDIEIRICASQFLSNKDTPVELIEIFVQ